MNTILETEFFSGWLAALEDKKAKARILARIQSLKFGNFGDCKNLGDGVSELRIHFGPGYRVYFGRLGAYVYLILCAGDKSDQSNDIAKAKTVWRSAKEEYGDGKDD